MPPPVLLDDAREVEIPELVQLVPRTMDERLLTAPPPFDPPDEPEVEAEGPESPDHDIDMISAAAVRATGEGEATDGPIDVDEKMDIFES